MRIFAAFLAAVWILGASMIVMAGSTATQNETGKTITYALSAASNAGVVPSATKSVTLTISAP